MTGVEGLMAEHFRRLIGEKTKAALGHLRARGRIYSGVARFGFQATCDGRLEPHPGEQTTLGLVSSLRGAGASWRDVSRQLAEQGIAQRNGKPWSVALLHRIARRIPAGRSVDATAA